MNILHTQHLYPPYVGGSEEVIKQLSERLVKRGHNVTVATSTHPARNFKELNGVKIEQFKLSGNTVTGVHGTKAEQRRYIDFISQDNFDLMLNSCAQTWSTDLVFPLLETLSCKKVFLPSGYSALNHLLFRRYYGRMPAILNRYDHVVYFSNRYQDKEFGDRSGVKHYSIIPNAANEDEFLKPPKGFRQQFGITTPYMILTVGNHYKNKGHRWVIDAFKRLNRPDVSLVILGQNNGTLFTSCYNRCLVESQRNPLIKNLTVDRSWVVSAFQEADIFAFASAVEASPLVILEAMAAKLPFVTTNCGSVADYSAYGKIVAHPSEMAGEITTLLNDEKLRKDRATKGFKAWQEEYTWEKVVDSYVALYQKLIGGRDE